MQSIDVPTPPVRPTRRTPLLTLQTVLTALPLLLTLGVFALFLTVYFAYAWNLFKFPFDYDQGEGFELYDAIRLARGQNFYLDNAAFPFYSSNYPPVYRTLLVPLIWLLGPKLYVGRVLAFACSLAVGALVFVAARALWKRQQSDAISIPRSLAWLIPIIVSLAFFAANYVYHVAPLARAHLPMVMFAMAGIVCLDRAFESRIRLNRQWLWAGLGVALLMTAGFTKLQAIDALAAGFVFLLLRRPKWFAIALAVCAAFAAAFVLLMQAATQGQFWLNVVAANVNDYDIDVTWRTYYQWFCLQGPLIVCSVLYVIWDVVAAIRARSFRPITLWSLYFVAGSALGMLTGKWGAGPSYLIAAIAASCVCTAGLFARLAQRTTDDAAQKSGRRKTVLSVLRLPSSVSVLFAVALLIQAKSNIHLPVTGRLFGPIAQALGVAGEKSVYPPYPYYDTIGYTQLGHFVDPADIANGWDLVNTLANVKGPVWSEEAMLTLWAGKDVVTNPTQLLNLSKNNMLDTREMIRMIRAKAFGAVVFRAQFYPKDVKAALVEHYYWAKMVRMNGFEYWVLLPNA